MTTGSLPGVSSSGSAAAPRDRLASVVRPRPRAGPVVGLVLALGFAAIVAPAVTAESWLGAMIVPDRPAPITVRVPPFAGADEGPRGGGVVIGRGETPGLSRAADAQAVLARQPTPASGLAAYFVILFALAAIYSHHCRRSNRGRLLRVQLINLGVLAAVAIAVKVLMLMTTVSVLAVPIALAAIVPTLVLDRTVGLATGVLAALVMSMVVPFDLGVATILLAQASVAGLIVPDRQRSPVGAAVMGAAAGAIGAALTYGIYLFLSTGVAPWAELSQPLASPWVATLAGGMIALVLAAISIPIYQFLVGEITHGTLVRLEDLAHPMLRQIATKSPGTWQHSLAMANMAELAANAIGANGRLVRVGAYFHDLGKSLQPKYFIENLEAGEVSPHEKLPPEVSCDAIFAHVTEGLTVARRAKLPERIVDFMHMHHGNGVLEYFWARCQEQGNPNHRTVEDFRYPGVPPQSRETAILAICDAVEAASRTLKRADEQTIGSLVQRIVYGKLHLGQLDDSGLSMADLRRISDSLRETIKHAHHGRIEYPWQKAEAAEAAAASGATTAPSPVKESTTQRLMKEPRLDSLDSPRPMWQRTATESSPPATVSSDPQIGVATTAVMGKGGERTSSPSTPPDVLATTAPTPAPVTRPVTASAAPASSPLTTLRGRDGAPSSQPPRAPAPMTPSDAAIAVAPTFPPDVDRVAPGASGSMSARAAAPAPPADPPPAAAPEAAPPADAPPPRFSAATIATPSTVMAAVIANPVVGIAPTTLPGVTTDRLTPPPAEERVTAKRPSQPHPAEAPTEPLGPSALRASGPFGEPPAPSPSPSQRDSVPPVDVRRDSVPPRRDSKPPPAPPGSAARRDSQPPIPSPGRRDLSIEHFPPPVEDSGDVISGRPRPEPAYEAETEPSVVAARPKRQRQPAMIVDDPAPPAPPPPPDAESASTQPRLAVFRPSAALPLPAPPQSDPEIRPPAAKPRPKDDKRARRPSSQWAEGLASRIDRAFEDEVANSTPIHGPSPSEIASLAGKPETTKLTPLHEIEQLVRESVSEDTAEEDLPILDGWDRDAPPGARTEPQAAVDADGHPLDGGRRRSTRTTEEVEPEAIEASIEEVPRVASRPDGPIVGPPPSTRPTTQRTRRIKPEE